MKLAVVNDEGPVLRVNPIALSDGNRLDLGINTQSGTTPAEVREIV